jgi:hypothetical protein
MRIGIGSGPVSSTAAAFATHNCQPWQLPACGSGCGRAPATPQLLLDNLLAFIVSRRQPPQAPDGVGQ